MKTRHYTLRDVARVLKVKPYQVTYALTVGHVPEPGTRINNKRIFAPEDIDRLATHFGVEMRSKPGTKTHEAQGGTVT